MSDNLVIGGATFTGVTGIKATDTSDNVVTFEKGGDTLTQYITGTLTSYTNDTLTELADGRFSYAPSSLTSVSFPNVTTIGGSAFTYSRMHSISLPKLQKAKTNAFASCYNLTVLVFPEYRAATTTASDYEFSSCTKLQAIDFGPLTTYIGRYNVYNGSTVLTTVIIRNPNTVVPLPHTNCFTNTPFASGKAGGTLYVPSALISSYQSATNWSTIFGYGNGAQNQILPIEGSIYETQYADGTPIPTT